MSLFKAANYSTIAKNRATICQKELIKSKGIKLCELDATYGTGTAQILIKAYLIDFCDLVNIKEDAKLNEFQLTQCSNNILRTCNGITIPELARMFSEFISGKYGRFYGQMDIMSIGEWTRMYMQERGEVICKNQDVRKFILMRDQNRKD